MHRFSKPDNVKKVLESGAIPDAAMIHAARKKRQRAREMGDFIAVEEEEPEDTGKTAENIIIIIKSFVSPSIEHTPSFLSSISRGFVLFLPIQILPFALSCHKIA